MESPGSLSFIYHVEVIVMISRQSNRPSAAKTWTKNRCELTMHLSDTDSVFFRHVNSRGVPASVGSKNAGNYCTVIIGHKKLKGIRRLRKIRDFEEYTGVSINVLPYDDVFTCIINRIGVPSAIGRAYVDQNVTIIVHQNTAGNVMNVL